jgi:predicted AlkP superfamily phosphohydrolase/phosphomutase
VSGLTRRVVLIALDAAEPRLIEQWMGDGSLPHLRALRGRGAYGRLASSADWLAGSPWPTFYSGTLPSDHGLYHHLRWQADRMQFVRPSPDCLPLDPFWRELSRLGPRVIAIDPPMTYPAEPFNGVEISGWASHDGLVPPSVYPTDVMRWVEQEVGGSPRTDEEHVPLPIRRAFGIRDEQIRAVHMVSKLTVRLMERERWDVLLAAFSATHRCGHQLWDHTGLAKQPDPADQSAFEDALREVYIASDAALGRIVSAAGDSQIIAFSLHGMGVETSRVDILPEMLRRIIPGESSPLPSRKSLLRRVRGWIPNSWRHAVKHRLPVVIQDRLTAFWRLGGTNWPHTRAFCQVADLQGYIRINLKGREASGVVEPGAEFDELCSRITDGLLTFRDADTGEPVVREVVRSDRLYPPGPRRAELPDLLVGWAPSPVAGQRAIVSPQLGQIDLPTPGRNPTGRSGNHRPHGFFIGVGEGFEAGANIEDGHILDLAPTVYAMLNLPCPRAMRGRDLRSLSARDRPLVSEAE